jgi:hypothetical protein
MPFAFGFQTDDRGGLTKGVCDTLLSFLRETTGTGDYVASIRQTVSSHGQAPSIS